MVGRLVIRFVLADALAHLHTAIAPLTISQLTPQPGVRRDLVQSFLDRATGAGIVTNTLGHYRLTATGRTAVAAMLQAVGR
uniref:hypothetical protein n=1 Tax=Micromonospora sp. NBC_00855 TaxID=2975978 RepID=UPI0037C5A20A|nr:hypothetical protein OHB51_35410 [Micromonospora sp. NBC_00855]